MGQGCTNPARQVAVVTKFCTVTPNICRFLVWGLLHVTLLEPRILRWLLYFWKICAPLGWVEAAAFYEHQFHKLQLIYFLA
jgi:hypothetical protein